MKPALVFLTLIAAFVPSVVIAAEPLKIFVFTNEVPSGSVDEQLKARRESVQDLVKAFSSEKYAKVLTVVKSRDMADVTIELLSRGETTTSAASSSTRASGGASTSASRSSSVTKQFLKFRVSAGNRTDNLTTEDQLPWPKMAERAAEELATWISANVAASRP